MTLASWPAVRITPWPATWRCATRVVLPTPLEPVARPKLIDPHLAKIEEWVERSRGKVRADVVHGKLGDHESGRSVERRRRVSLASLTGPLLRQWHGTSSMGPSASTG